MRAALMCWGSRDSFRFDSALKCLLDFFIGVAERDELVSYGIQVINLEGLKSASKAPYSDF